MRRPWISLVAAFALCTWAQPAVSTPTPDDAATRGAQLFDGQRRFAGGGPACVACHSVGGLPFPNGGTLAPDLTHVSHRMGAQGVQVALETLYFPAMVPLYRAKPLTLEERGDLTAFFERADARAAPSETWRVAGFGGLVFVVSLLITGWMGRSRLGSVRRRLVDDARAEAAQRATTRGGAS
jgi:hypothetical protein